MNHETPRYSILIPDDTVGRASRYLGDLRAGRVCAGARLRNHLRDADLPTMTERDLFGLLFDTKTPQIFAESAVAGDGSDWSPIELGLLGDISVAVPVTVFDDGRHTEPTPHEIPFRGTLIFTPGALLRNDRRHAPADWEEATGPDGALSPEGYYGLYRRRLLPVFHHVNQHAARARAAFITMPALGCGQFAGPFRGQLGGQLQAVLERFLNEYGDSWPNLKVVYFDPYRECENARHEIHGISFLVRPLMGSERRGKPQLCRPTAYAEPGDDFTDCTLYSIVAWDHVSWPGNDYYVGSRSTDDGVKAAATDSMSAMTRAEGNYDPASGKYQPPKPHRVWAEVVEEGLRSGRLRLWGSAAP